MKLYVTHRPSQKLKEALETASHSFAGSRRKLEETRDIVKLTDFKASMVLATRVRKTVPQHYRLPSKFTQVGETVPHSFAGSQKAERNGGNCPSQLHRITSNLKDAPETS